MTEREHAAEPVLRVNDLACERGDRCVLEGVGFELAPGEVAQVHGPNGSGKTTLLRVLCGLTRPTRGEVQWRGIDITWDALELRADLAYVGHSDGIKLELTSIENLCFARALSARPSRETPSAILESLGLHGLDHVTSGRLSAGQRRRLALGRLLVGTARLWILDEPFTALDVASSAAVGALLHSHLAQGGLLVLSSHQPIEIVGFPIKKVGL